MIRQPWVVFIGDKPSPRMKPGAKAFEGASCEARLKEWIRTVCYGHTYRVYNYSEEAAEIWTLWHIEDGDILIALGNNASKWLNIHKHFKLPHPSGRNRQINDKEFIEKKLAECKKYIEDNK